jgi:hypothetical protein
VAGWAAILAGLKNTVGTIIFGQIAPDLRTPVVAVRDIDENRSLAYKPRQLSAMTRSDRGGSIVGRKRPAWGLQHRRTYLIHQADCIRQIARSAENDP